MSSIAHDHFIAASLALVRAHPELASGDADRPQAMGLPLCGRNMNSLHLYDVVAGTRLEVVLPRNGI